MDWQWTLLLILVALMVLFASGMPIAFCFLVFNIVGVYFLWGGMAGLEQLISSFFDSVSTFTLLPLPLFILMGEVLLASGISPEMLDALDKWFGRIPGRLGLLAVAGGTLFATLSGSGMASVAMLGTTLVPEMEKRGYSKTMSLGPIMGAGGLAVMIPPSAMAVVIGAIGSISVGKLLMAIIIPGLLMASLYAGYIIIRCWLTPELAPPYDVTGTPLREKVTGLLRYVFPVGFIVFLVVGVIFFGIATPTEAAASGALGCYILAAYYRKLNWHLVRESLSRTLEITVMIFFIIVGAKAFSQILVFSGATQGLANFALSFPLAPILVIVAMQIVGLIMGMFLLSAAIVMITLPMFMPIIHTLGFDPVWFGVTYVINMEVATISPPFGASLFVMKAVSTPGTTMEDVFRAAIPFCLIDILAIGLIMVFPALVLWLPGVMR